MDALFITMTLLAVIFFYIWYIYNEVRIAKRKKMQQLCKNYVVVARVKKHENGHWVCKFFHCGDHLGYLDEKPSSERIKAIVFDYDQQNRLYKLQEYVED